jgi:DNA polymerase-3 subunit delta'
MPFSADEAFVLLEQSRARGRFAQAYLITGAPGAGKFRLLGKLASVLLGAKDEPLKHPDVHTLEPQKKTRVIGVEAMRELIGALQMSSRLGGAKLAIIHDADRLNEAAANALLRTLEEPPGHTYFFLLSTQPEQLLETILSRCLEVPLRSGVKPALTARQQALTEALRGAPLAGDIPAVFGLARQFSMLLAEAKAEIDEQSEAAFKKEEVLLKQVGARKEAIEDREDFFKALTESRYRAERDGLLAVIEQWFADALRQQHGAPALDLARCGDATAELAAKFSAAELLRRTAALAELRDHFGRNIQEQLAIECAFLKAFGS